MHRRQAAVPLEHADPLVDRTVRERRLDRAEDGADRVTQPLREPDQVVHRHLAAPVQGRHPLRPLGDEPRLHARDRERDPIELHLRVGQQLAQPDLVEPVAHGRVAIDGDLERARRDARAVPAQHLGGFREPGALVGRGQAQRRVSHERRV